MPVLVFASSPQHRQPRACPALSFIPDKHHPVRGMRSSRHGLCATRSSGKVSFGTSLQPDTMTHAIEHSCSWDSLWSLRQAPALHLCQCQGASVRLMWARLRASRSHRKQWLCFHCRPSRFAWSWSMPDQVPVGYMPDLQALAVLADCWSNKPPEASALRQQ